MRKNILKRSVKSKLFPIISLLLIVGVLGSLVAIFARDRSPDEEPSLEISYGGGFIGDDIYYRPEYANMPGVLTYDLGSRNGEDGRVKVAFGGIAGTISYPKNDTDYKMRLTHKQWQNITFSPISKDGDVGVFETDINLKEYKDYVAGNDTEWLFKMVINGSKDGSDSTNRTINKEIFWETNGHTKNKTMYGVGPYYNTSNEYDLKVDTEYSLKVIVTTETTAVYINGVCIYSDTVDRGSIYSIFFEFRSDTHNKGTIVEFDNTYCNNFVAN